MYHGLPALHEVILPWGNTGLQQLPLSSFFVLFCYLLPFGARGGVVVKALRYKPAGRGFDSRWCHWNFSVT